MLILLRTETTAAALEAAIAALPDALVLEPGASRRPDGAALSGLARARAERRDRVPAGILLAPHGGSPAIVVRVKPLSSADIEDALAAALAFEPDGILLKGTDGRVEIERLGAKLAVLEAEHGRPAGSIGILASVADHAAGVLALSGLRPHPRLAGLVFDPAVLASALGCGPEAHAISQAAATTILAASACGVPAIVSIQDTHSPPRGAMSSALRHAEEPAAGRRLEARATVSRASRRRFAAPQHDAGSASGAETGPGEDQMAGTLAAACREGFGGVLIDEPGLVATLRPSSAGSARTSSRASPRNNRGSRTA